LPASQPRRPPLGKRGLDRLEHSEGLLHVGDPGQESLVLTYDGWVTQPDASTTARAPYRGADDGPRADAPRELAYAPMDESAGRDGQLALIRHVSMPLIGAVLGAWLFGPVGGVVALIAAIFASVWMWRTRKKTPGARLVVDAGVLSVSLLSLGREERFRLDDLANVELDTKTIERVMEGGSAIPAMRFIDAKIGPKVETARIVLVSESGRQVRLTEEFLAHFDSTEWLGKIRVFLRKHGWVPEDEREAAASSDRGD
jgi:hypothetical protein